ncbi:aromatic ring-hydroxylating dioxygenase subunit alpha [Sphingomonas lycopersici]|uniref:Aromatic ring-hydroxylating dioxygenase subunit alpha n=1 Tax=Sphingomonas lycopersici TaxID=2951807 RepID=A0AA41ZB03_9SPHN|nr:aromatic ring-hydroxylating dioxygenase subunit alpha [Sphingomonas lycopersici]MCW6536755.1 aromatic ring-hydroxylating dioxygenase subunit alpha [Sphingomonas lycopersici]
MYIEDAWYVAAWGREIDRQPFARRICDVPIVLYRTSDGAISALHDQCPHRFAPLHLGVVEGDRIQCPYHGLVFAADGQCVHSPHGHAPSAARIRAFRVVERYSLVWIWFGDPDKAEVELIPDFSCLVDPDLRTVSGVFMVGAHYELVTDNLMDLSHVAFLHKNGIGSDAIATGKHRVQQHGTTIFSDRWCADAPAPPVWDALFGDYGRNVDHWLDMRWDPPANMLLDVGVTPTGQPRDEGISTLGLDILTPETATTTHYFWAMTRDFGQQDAQLDEMIAGATEQAFQQEDLPMLEAVQKQMGSRAFDAMKPLLLPFDEGAVRARRVVAAVVEGRRSIERPLTKKDLR